MKYKVKIYLKNADDISVQMTAKTEHFPLGYQSCLSLFISENHPNIQDLLSDGFEVYLITFRRIKNA